MTAQADQVGAQGSRFSGGVVALFGTHVLSAGIGILSGILLARLLGPTAKGEYYLIVLLPATALIFLQLGLPQAFGYFAARGQTATMLGKAAALAGGLSVAAAVAFVILWSVAPDASSSSASAREVALAFLGFPFALHAMLTTGIVTGRKAIRWYASINVATAVAGLVLMVVILVGLGASVLTALVVYLIAIMLQAFAMAIAARRMVHLTPDPRPISYRQLLHYGLPFYPGSLATFLSQRADVYLIALLLPSPSEPLGYYSLAVGLAEIVMFFPRAVATLFFPHVAGGVRAAADGQVGLVSRVTLLVTGLVAILMVPAAAGLIWVLLPAYGPSLAPLVVLLPGTVALSMSFVMNGYLQGIGRPGATSSVSVVALGVNVLANVLLVPRLGIVGAAAASLVSYSVTSAILTRITARASGVRAIDMWMPRTGDVRYVIRMSLDIVRQLRQRPRRGQLDG